MSMTSRSEQEWQAEMQRRATSQRACDRFFEWAKEGGKQEINVRMEARDWAVVIGAVTLHAAELTVQDGNPDLLLSIAVELVAIMRQNIGTAMTDRIIGLVGTMMSGVEQ